MRSLLIRDSSLAMRAEVEQPSAFYFFADSHRSARCASHTIGVNSRVTTLCFLANGFLFESFQFRSRKVCPTALGSEGPRLHSIGSTLGANECTSLVSIAERPEADDTHIRRR